MTIYLQRGKISWAWDSFIHQILIECLDDVPGTIFGAGNTVIIQRERKVILIRLESDLGRISFGKIWS